MIPRYFFGLLRFLHFWKLRWINKIFLFLRVPAQSNLKWGFKRVKVNDFKVELTRLEENSNHIKYDFRFVEQYLVGQPSIRNRYTDQQLETSLKDKEWYF